MPRGLDPHPPHGQRPQRGSPRLLHASLESWGPSNAALKPASKVPGLVWEPLGREWQGSGRLWRKDSPEDWWAVSPEEAMSWDPSPTLSLSVGDGLKVGPATEEPWPSALLSLSTQDTSGAGPGESAGRGSPLLQPASGVTWEQGPAWLGPPPAVPGHTCSAPALRTLAPMGTGPSLERMGQGSGPARGQLLDPASTWPNITLQDPGCGGWAGQEASGHPGAGRVDWGLLEGAPCSLWGCSQCHPTPWAGPSIT